MPQQTSLKETFDIIIENNLDNPNLCIEDLCAELTVSRMHLYRQFIKLTGLSPSRYICVVRLQHAKEMLRETELNISEIAYEVGFRDPNYFARKFKEELSVSPRAYRKTLLEE